MRDYDREFRRTKLMIQLSMALIIGVTVLFVLAMVWLPLPKVAIEQKARDSYPFCFPIVVGTMTSVVCI